MLRLLIAKVCQVGKVRTAVPEDNSAFSLILPCTDDVKARELTMSNMATRFIKLSVTGLQRRPLLTVLMVYSVGFGVAALIVAFTLLRDTFCGPNPRKQYLVSIAPNIAGRSRAFDSPYRAGAGTYHAPDYALGRGKDI